MEIRLSRESEVPLRRQLAEQIVFLIGVGKLRPGQQLPSVRELARRLKIHHNTVSGAYQALVRRTWLVRQRGSRLVVGSRELRRDVFRRVMARVTGWMRSSMRRCAGHAKRATA